VTGLFFGCVVISEGSSGGSSDGGSSTDENRVSNPTDGIKTGLSSVNFAPEAGNTWTFMIYLDADNDLETYLISDFQEMVDGMASAANDANMNLIVMIDRISGYSASTAIGGSDWQDTRLYRITSSGYTRMDDGGGGAGHVANLGEKNMGDPAVLSDFIDYCTTNFSADHYALILWNHGSGSRSFEEEVSDLSGGSKSSPEIVKSTVKGICSDSTNSDILYLDELRDGIDNYFDGTPKLDLIGFDACLMATVEVGYELRNSVNYLTGSMAEEWGYGWDYERLFQNMTYSVGVTNADADELARVIVKAYRDSTTSVSTQTQSAINLANIAVVKTAVDNLAPYIYNENKKSNIETSRDAAYHFYTSEYKSVLYPYYDLSDLCYQIYNNDDYSTNLKTKAQALVTAVENAVVASYGGVSYGDYYGTGSNTKRGLSIFFSRGNLEYSGKFHYDYQWWYTTRDTASDYGASYLYGCINFCNFDNDGTVETWKELMEAWYDADSPYSNSDTF
jgi:clostripain